MATKSEIQGWIWYANNKKQEYENIVDDCDKKIARLEPVYQKLGEIKDDFRSARKSTEEIFDEKGAWRGEKYTSFCNAGRVLDGACSDYYNQLDAAQDAVNEKIGELKAKKLEFIPLIGKLVAQISQLWVDFQNAAN